MLPLSDGLPARRFPVVTVTLIVANFAVFLFYELPDLNAAVFHASFYPCTVDGACRGPLPWGLSWITAMFLHGGWDHILGNMLFLAIFGKNVEDAFGPVRYLVLYFAGGFVAMLTQTAMTLWFGTAADSQVPELGASVAFFAHVGGFVFGLVAARILTGAGRVAPRRSNVPWPSTERARSPGWDTASWPSRTSSRSLADNHPGRRAGWRPTRGDGRRCHRICQLPPRVRRFLPQGGSADGHLRDLVLP